MMLNMQKSNVSCWFVKLNYINKSQTIDIRVLVVYDFVLEYQLRINAADYYYITCVYKIILF